MERTNPVEVKAEKVQRMSRLWPEVKPSHLHFQAQFAYSEMAPLWIAYGGWNFSERSLAFHTEN